MGKLIRPVLFSQRFPVTPADLETFGVFDPVLNSDTRLFVDPLLLAGSDDSRMRTEAFGLLTQRFDEIIRLLAASQRVSDPAWIAASRKLDLSERRETGLGYGGASTSGASRPAAIRQTILSTTKEIISLGEKDPQIISMMGFFEEGVGADTISDLTTNIILPVLCRLTTELCSEHDIRTQRFSLGGGHDLPANPFSPNQPIILVPRDVLRNLPFASDWSEVSKVVFYNQELRDRFSGFLGNVAKTTMSDVKRALRRTFLESLEAFRTAFNAVLNASDSYDPERDMLNLYAFRDIIQSQSGVYSVGISPPLQKSKAELLRIVKEIIDHYKFLIENNNMWELLWNGADAKKERAAQIVFFGISDVCCKANNIDISPETHSGGGPVDFKFSSGYSNRVLVEVKNLLEPLSMATKNN